MGRPVTFVRLDLAKFLLRVLKTPESERGVWVTTLAESLVEGVRGTHSYADELFDEVEEFRENDKNRKKVSKDSVESTDSRISTTRQSGSQANKQSVSRRARAQFVRPSVEEVQAYCTERKNRINPSNFCDHYEARGWRLKSGPMVDWKAAVRTWEKNSFSAAARVPVSAGGGVSDEWH